MSAMEQSLRRALEAGDASDPAFREQIYSASERALERMLAARQSEPAAAEIHRIRLAETINRVEEDYFVPPEEEIQTDEPYDPADTASDPAREQHGYHDVAPDEVENVEDHRGHEDPADHGRPDERDVWHDDVAIEDARHDRPDEGRPASGNERDDFDAAEDAAPALARGDAESRPPIARHDRAGADPDMETWSPGASRRLEDSASARRRRLKPFLIGVVVLLLALAAGIAVLYSMLFGSAPTGSAARAQTEVEGAPTVAAADWVGVFDGTQLELISTPTGGQVSSITGSGDRPAVRLATATQDGEVDVSIGPGLVNAIEGRNVRVEITAGSRDGARREFGVRCLFGGDTVCGRQRFTTLQDKETFVFDMTVPANPSAAGNLAIDPGFGNDANDLDLYSVRLRILAKA